MLVRVTGLSGTLLSGKPDHDEPNRFHPHARGMLLPLYLSGLTGPLCVLSLFFFSSFPLHATFLLP
jgi:hypothetical protein